MNIQEYSKKFMIFLNVLTSSIILWGQNNDTDISKKLEKFTEFNLVMHDERFFGNYGIRFIFIELL